MENNIILFFNSNFFIAFVTVLVGSFAIYLYIKQKKDQKRDAANIIISEIRNAENTIAQIKNSGGISFSTRILPSSSWNEYSFLFVNQLDRDEMDTINNFYNQCTLLDKALEQADSIPDQLKSKGDYVQQILVKMASESENVSKYEENRKKFFEIMAKENTTVQPVAFVEVLKGRLSTMNTIITSTTIGDKLKKIAKIK